MAKRRQLPDWFYQIVRFPEPYKFSPPLLLVCRNSSAFRVHEIRRLQSDEWIKLIGAEPLGKAAKLLGDQPIDLYLAVADVSQIATTHAGCGQNTMKG